ncbi:N-acetyltransferase 11 [Heterocephalus glaber]|uniref:N-alpha-acetyltransferase 40 n=1 Tax=Heterocephalus glaber TaxID=10181 RepID=G5B6G0_HETGA|nr:N-acetyltransferase 11 [Heterocephalus glaber]
MDAVCAKVDAANRLGDPLEAFPVFKKYDRNGYEQSEWGWKDREKREEMTDDRAWYLIAWENSCVPVAFSHFRFDVECGDEVLYCYEVQLESKVRRKGLGKFLIQILQLMANSTQMKKVMLTVFKHNHGAYQFFREALQFEIDDSSPSMSGCCGEDCSYEILSRKTKLNVSIECKRVSGLEPATVDWAFDLTKMNMQSMYEQSEWGWKDREKREEMTDDRAWYLIAWENSCVPVAFSHFRFDVECGDEVLYCYEVQLESKVRRKGLGKFLIQILQLMANSTQMKKVMLTVFKHNHGAYQFFREALQFEIDDSSPSMSGCCGEDCSYEILSRKTKFGDSQHSHAGGHCGGCCH